MNVISIRVCRWAFATALIALLSLWSLPASASPMWFSYDGAAANTVVNISYGSFNGGAYTGQNLGRLSTTSNFTGSTQFYTFCVDLLHEVNPGQVYQVDLESVTDPTYGITDGARVAYLFTQYGTNHIIPGGAYGSLTGNQYAAALQLAIWDELANGGAPPTIHSALQYTVSSAIATQVQTFLTAANANAGTGVWADPTGPGITNPYPGKLGQGFIIPTGGPNIPEPSTLTLFSLALGYLGVAGVRRSLLNRSSRSR